MPPTRPLGAALLAAIFLLASASVTGAVTANGRLQIIHLDVGQGDGAVIITPLGQVIMIDDGVNGNPTPACGVKVPQQLQALGVTHVDAHFDSHYHSDHLGLFKTIFGSGGIATVDIGWDRGGSYTTSYYTDYVNTLGSKRRTLTKGQVITFDSLSAHPVTIKCVDLNAAGISTTDENSLSVQLKVSYGNFDESFGGDTPGQNSGSYKNVETTVGPEMGNVEVYKVHHHGSATSSWTDWLNATQPKVAVVSEGTGNSYGHPTSAAMTRIHNAGTHCYWTETGSGATPVSGWDKVSNGQIIISATWEPGGVDTIRGNGFADTFTNSGTADATPPVVSMTSPDGGEDWKAGSSHAITWTASDNVGVTTVDLAYSTNGGASFGNVIASGLANSGSYSWSVPNAPGTTLKVRALAHDAAGNIGSDSSAANFTVSTWTITASAGANGVIVPSGAVAVVQGASQRFSIAPAVGAHLATLTVDGAGVTPDTTYTFSEVAANHTLAASFAADQYAISVTTVGGGTVSKSPDQASYAYGTNVELAALPGTGWAFSGWSGDTSGTADSLSLTVTQSRNLTATFLDVAPPVVTVSAPVGGESWLEGSAQAIGWTASDNAGVDSVNVDWSPSGADGPWLEVARGLANTGSYEWTLPLSATDSALVRVTAYDAAGNAGVARSDSVFAIVNPNAGVAGSGAVLALWQPQPNPGPGTTLLRFTLPGAGRVRLEVLDLAGRRLWQQSGEQGAGLHAVRWDGTLESGGRAGAGLYFVRLVTPWGTRTGRLAWLR
ncbi:MAG TPA: Ser-Thr-rich GPI-anchored membrane family protein [Terriglobales bacterium]|nr:Ser-Thr-rich GPI-anchored membrane family protein [Terriglobales bacterium]